ncbi:hypothetical protein A2574_02250 [Candidatus Shapirobacteria bacterium RIFOXYD1_FULL_38_32]|uniref:Lipoprotein n=4 Tax=Patescibacteria group TaxID=1783273 RepID=A0A0G0M290_9BACT|nr:MAG: hypothetical protein US90_C0031G0008 [Candidatus Shapirobacteria bacterium GW2011_GWE2_38_30]KKQ90349.1 MAG: hypothetical protein UT14_C0039G0014 [Candidatus Shapirobacteria bacterium GW2011_GWE1_38_92]OGJ05775.1 MAG: hypothetical protein A2192_00260 [Candidatus Nomurabacteria bacterium RIFOXYA1_FULL_35_17]OGL56993.1 MAG: hypothetical protein A2367_02110 [Candidatus Shapirobacteria bacterium RIFOXYB1_FULL_38_38]OGL57255.1 MAG: hypothetical protein A2410_00790 [Candidatus Shapirobacteria
MKKIITLSLIFLSTFLLSSCGKKNTSSTPSPTPTPRAIEMKPEERPIVKLIPRSDGHELKLSILNIPNYVKQIEYELIYSATDNGLEIEKGLGDTLTLESQNIERKLLLGTESCTSGCKYKYDEGITGGTLSLIFITKENQIIPYETEFSLQSGSQIKKNGGQMELITQNYQTKIDNLKTTSFYLLLKDYGNSKNPSDTKPSYSYFASNY